MQILIDIPDAQADKLRNEARRLGIEPSALATAAVLDLLHREAADFTTAADHVIRKNQELYRRLRRNSPSFIPLGSSERRSGLA